MFRSDVSASSSSKISEASCSSKKYNNIFKSAFNKGITFLSKIANSSGSNTPNSTSTGSKPAESDKNHDSSPSETPSDCSSPDSLKTEMIFFKPINREPKTQSNTKSVLLKIPTIRTASSTEPYFSSPCPSESPIIPITPKRQSAFSLVGPVEDDTRDCYAVPVGKPKTAKRRNCKPSPKKPEPKRIKQQVETVKKSVKAARKIKPDENLKEKAKTEAIVVISRKTRSMDKQNQEVEKCPQAVSEKKDNKKSPRKKETFVVKERPQTKKAQSTATEKQGKRVTRSQSLKH